MDLILQDSGEKPTIKEIHLGGGTPHFFFYKNLEDLINGIFVHAKKPKIMSFSFEPITQLTNICKSYNDLGFRRVSFGVQDYSEKVQKQFIVYNLS
jgi:oxygen-independent coproporphyrinogen-3 oxidase